MSMVRFYLEGNIKEQKIGGSRGGAQGARAHRSPPPPPLISGSGSAPDISTFLDCLAVGQKGEYFSPFQKA